MASPQKHTDAEAVSYIEELAARSGKFGSKKSRQLKRLEKDFVEGRAGPHSMFMRLTT